VIGVNDLSFGVVNIGSSSSLDIAVTNTGVAPKGNLGVTSAAINGASSWFKFSACGGTQSCTFAPALSIAMSTVVGITCNPPIAANAGDMQTATVTFTSDTDATADTISTVGCTAGKSALATTTGSVTFSSQLVTTQSTSMPVTVTNSGNVAATFYFRVTGASAAAFSVSTGSGCGTGATNLCALPASGGSVSFDLTFTPTAEGDISAGLDLVANSSPFPQLVLAGRGIDRHIAMPASVDFPDTFRNPSPTAMAVPVTVSNIGEYPLHVTDVTVVDAPIWTLADATTSFDVPGLGTHDVMVRFAPIAAGKTPAGMLAITSDDRTNPMLHVVLTGIGKDRDIEVGPATIDFGDRSVGVSTRLSEIQPGPLMSILNRDDTATFRLREVIATGDSVFAAETTDGGSASDIDLAPGDTRDLDVVFAPSTEGEFRADLMIYLDDDPVAQTSVAVHGRALTADIHGGGGCDAADPGGAFAVALVLAALALAARKRLPGVRRR
jgi:uncharacterized protein (TIGR03382 family)